jgi:hypothetical protein
MAMTAYVFSQREMLSALSEVRPFEILLLLALSIAGLFAQAQQFRTALTVSSIEIGIVEATGLTAVNTMANYYVPARGGTVVRGSYMVAVHSMTVGAYAVLTAATVAVDWCRRLYSLVKARETASGWSHRFSELWASSEQQLSLLWRAKSSSRGRIDSPRRWTR